MDIDMIHIDHRLTEIEVTEAIAKVLHTGLFAQESKRLLNFRVYLEMDKNGTGRNTGCGTLTLPTPEIGLKFFLQHRNKGLKVGGGMRNVRFVTNTRRPPRHIVQYLNRVDYQNPRVIQQKTRRREELRETRIRVNAIAFGSLHRSLLSLEWKRSYHEVPCWLCFQDEHQLMRISDEDVTSNESYSIVISYNIVQELSLGHTYGQPCILFRLLHAPTFEKQGIYRNSAENQSYRSRLGSLDDSHSLVVAYASLTLLVTLSRGDDLQVFDRLRAMVHLPEPRQNVPDAEKEPRYSRKKLDKLRQWFRVLGELHWEVAFQCEALHRNLILDADELLELKPSIEYLTQKHGPTRTADILRFFGVTIRGQGKINHLSTHLADAETAHANQSNILPPVENAGMFRCHHITFTPTTCRLEGPYPDQSNRVLRLFPNYQHYFLRVNFTEENCLRFRRVREVDGATFVQERVGGILHQGFNLGGRHFDFLGYSQSALRDHAVWFVTPFYDAVTDSRITADSIRKQLGNFERVIKQPARYGARLSQAFSGTDPSITIRKEQLIKEPDIERNHSVFTDGVGRISPLLADEIWASLLTGSRKSGLVTQTRPATYQIRIGGYKGMVSVDYTLADRKELHLRPSMEKFEANDSLDIEISRAFDRPAPMYLNRSLIMLLEDRKIPAEVFLDLQADAVEQARSAIKSLATSVNLLEAYHLGQSFNISSISRKLVQLGVDSRSPNPILSDAFFHRAMESAVIHVMRDLKYRSRIRVPESYALVGVADVHKYLREGQVFACIEDPETGKRTYLDGDMLIGRSPTVHPGDVPVQMVNAIGMPPPDSPFAIEPLANAVVFSVEGLRSLPSCLAGGDLDGDIYFLIGYKPLLVEESVSAARYPGATIKALDRASTIEDVADFVVDFINSDVIGLVSDRHLIIADQSTGHGVFDRDCLLLAELHSQAVDFAKSGTPVLLNDMPHYKFQAKPDWSAKELEPFADSKMEYYESNKAIGRLFREIVLPPFSPATVPNPSARSHPLTDVLRLFVERHDVDISIAQLRPFSKNIQDVLRKYADEMKSIRAMHAIEGQALTEEELLMGTILGKTSQPRKRIDLAERMNRLSNILVHRVKFALSGKKGTSIQDWVRRAWVAWDTSVFNATSSGSKSFGWIALGSIFDALGVLDGTLEDLRAA